MNTFSVTCSIEASWQQCMEFFSSCQHFGLRYVYSCFCSKHVAEMLPKSDIIVILARRKLSHVKSLSASTTLALGLAPPNDVPGCTSCAIHFLSGSILFSSLFSFSALAAINSRISVKGGIFNDSLTLINSPSRSSLKRNPPIREKSSIPVNKSKEDNLLRGRFSSAAAKWTKDVHHSIRWGRLLRMQAFKICLLTKSTRKSDSHGSQSNWFIG